MYACECKPKDKRKWFVMRRHERCSAFEGYRRVFSNFSDVFCLGCFRLWRTKARYVGHLPNASLEDVEALRTRTTPLALAKGSGEVCPSGGSIKVSWGGQVVR